MKILIIASGSKGNCTYIESNNTKILIDCGITLTRVKKELDLINVDLHDIDGILVTHTHKDHIGGLSALIKKTDMKVYIKDDLYKDLSKVVPKEYLNIIDDNSTIGDINIEIIHNSHDVASFGYIMESDNTSLVYITDTGYINRKYYSKIKNKNLYIIESNYNDEMLMNGPYPYILKQRVVGDSGHLSNDYTGKILKDAIGDKTKKIILAHISENNNTPEQALNDVYSHLKEVNFDKENIITANQYEITEMVVI